MSTPRTAVVQRQTSESSVRVALNLDGVGRSAISTGVGLYDQFLAVELVTGYYQLYFDTGEGYEPIDIYTTFERLDEAAFAILKTLNT